MIITIIIIIVTFSSGFAQERQSKFIMGVFGLQSPVGTKGFQKGSLAEIKDIIKEISNSRSNSQFGNINAAIAYRRWLRNKYPNFDFSGFVTNYMNDMYEFTKSKEGKVGIQILTPPLYMVFTDPQVENYRNDIENDRDLELELFEEFVLAVLNAEVDILKKSFEKKSDVIDILLDPYARPLGGWYLDDEPFVRNHDIQVIEKMGEEIRRIELKFVNQNKIFRDLPDSALDRYPHKRFIAFDCDDLHGYSGSMRKWDGKIYNRDGNTLKFEGKQIYTVLAENTFDVLMPDFYKRDTRFWGTIISDIRYEFVTTKRQLPLLMPVMSMEIYKEDIHNYTIDYFHDQIDYIESLKVDGIWVYIWDPGDPDFYGAKDFWFYSGKDQSGPFQKIKTDK